MWIEKVPRRPDFCGRPGCSLCYEWAEDNGEKIDGLVKWERDLLQGVPATTDQKIEIAKAAEQFHKDGVLLAATEPTPELPPSTASEERIVGKAVSAFLKDKRRKPIDRRRNKTLDDMTPKEIAKKGVEEKVEEKIIKQVDVRKYGFIPPPPKPPPWYKDKFRGLELSGVVFDELSKKIEIEAKNFQRNYARKYPDKPTPPLSWFLEKVAQQESEKKEADKAKAEMEKEFIKSLPKR